MVYKRTLFFLNVLSKLKTRFYVQQASTATKLLNLTCPDLKERAEAGRRVADHTLEAMSPMIRAILPVLFGAEAIGIQAKEQQWYRAMLEAFDKGVGLADFKLSIGLVY